MPERPGLTRSLPFGLFIGLMILEPFIQPFLPPGFDERWLYGVRVALVLGIMIALWRSYTELTDITSVKKSDWALSLGMGVAVFVLWIFLDFQPLAFASEGGFDPRTGNGVHLGLAAARLTGAILIVPIMEELFWRSFIFRWLHHPAFLSVDPSSVGLRALLISSVLFGTEHRLWFAGLIAGLAFSWLYRRSKNLWVPILAHAVTNGLLGAYVLSTGAWSFW